MTIGSSVIFHKDLPSTNTYAITLLRKEVVNEGTIIRADFQSAGKGQAGNKWESEKGKNLLFSIILYPTMIKASDQFLISMTISLGILDYLSSHVKGCSIKWPNDIYVGNDKIAGILIENSLMDDSLIYSVAGIGLNVNQQKFLSDATNPVSLNLITGREYDLESCFRDLLSAIDRRYDQLSSKEFMNIRRDYVSKLYRLNEWNNFSIAGSIVRGRIVSVNEDGMLIIEHPDKGMQSYSFKEIEFMP